MAMLTTATNADTQALDTLVPGWRELVRRLLWEAVDALEAVDPERALYTFRVKVWRIPASFTFRVRHLRAVLTIVLGKHP